MTLGSLWTVEPFLLDMLSISRLHLPVTSPVNPVNKADYTPG